MTPGKMRQPLDERGAANLLGTRLKEPPNKALELTALQRRGTSAIFMRFVLVLLVLVSLAAAQLERSAALPISTTGCSLSTSGIMSCVIHW